jgi:hypothetical protein
MTHNHVEIKLYYDVSKDHKNHYSMLLYYYHHL